VRCSARNRRWPQRDSHKKTPGIATEGFGF